MRDARQVSHGRQPPPKQQSSPGSARTPCRPRSRCRRSGGFASQRVRPTDLVAKMPPHDPGAKSDTARQRRDEQIVQTDSHRQCRELSRVIRHVDEDAKADGQRHRGERPRAPPRQDRSRFEALEPPHSGDEEQRTRKYTKKGPTIGDGNRREPVERQRRWPGEWPLPWLKPLVEMRDQGLADDHGRNQGSGRLGNQIGHPRTPERTAATIHGGDRGGAPNHDLRA